MYAKLCKNKYFTPPTGSLREKMRLGFFIDFFFTKNLYKVLPYIQINNFICTYNVHMPQIVNLFSKQHRDILYAFICK